ncbi:hypothetical protein SprV_0802606000 [Sparganum proliferum]
MWPLWHSHRVGSDPDVGGTPRCGFGRASLQISRVLAKILFICCGDQGVWWNAKVRIRPSHPPATSLVSGLLDSVLTPGSGGGGGESVEAAKCCIFSMKFLLQFLILVFIQERPLALILNNDSGIRGPQLVASSKIIKILKLENDIITIQTENFPMDYSEDYIYVWEVQAPPSRRITIRKNLLNLRAGDQLRISEIMWNKTIALGNFSATAPEFKKITSLGNALRLELILGESNSSSAMSSSGSVSDETPLSIDRTLTCVVNVVKRLPTDMPTSVVQLLGKPL